jgi:hypothetical protein
MLCYTKLVYRRKLYLPQRYQHCIDDNKIVPYVTNDKFIVSAKQIYMLSQTYRTIPYRTVPYP